MMYKNVLYLASGMAIGYYIAHRRVLELENTFAERLDKEIEDFKEFYDEKAKRKKAKEYAEDPEFFNYAVEAAEALSVYQGADIGPSTTVDHGVPDEADDVEPDEDDDLKDRAHEDREVDETPEEIVRPKPTVVIHQQAKSPVNYNLVSTPPKEEPAEESQSIQTMTEDDFNSGDSGFRQTVTTYFVGDDRLANEGDQVFTDEAREQILNDEILNLLKADPEARGGSDSIYVRNTDRKLEFQIVVSPGSYDDEVGEVVYATG